MLTIRPSVHTHPLLLLSGDRDLEFTSKQTLQLPWAYFEIPLGKEVGLETVGKLCDCAYKHCRNHWLIVKFTYTNKSVIGTWRAGGRPDLSFKGATWSWLIVWRGRQIFPCQPQNQLFPRTSWWIPRGDFCVQYRLEMQICYQSYWLNIWILN